MSATSAPPTVSIIIPVYDRAHLLGRAIQSVLDQTFIDWECIIVDDCSTDNPQAVVSSFADARLRFIGRETNGGGSVARNVGIEAARGEFVAFLDSDDWWFPEKLQRQIQAWQNSPDTGAVFCGYRRVVDVRSGREEEPWLPDPRANLRRLLLEHNYVGTTSAVMVRRSRLKQVGGFDETLPSCQDWDLWLRLARICDFEAIGEALLAYVYNPESISANADAVVRGHQRIWEKYRTEITEAGTETVTRHMVSLGRFHMFAGNTRQARNYYARALRLRPWDAACAIAFLAVLGGRRPYFAVRRAKRLAIKILTGRYELGSITPRKG